MNKYVKLVSELKRQGKTVAEILDHLKDGYALKVSDNLEYGLYVLNYDQIKSPKNHKITNVCRSLAVNAETLMPVSYAFDRFYNYGEVRLPHNGGYEFFEKLDGSLVTVFHHNGQWLYRTKSMVMPTAYINGVSGRTWKDLIEEALDWENLQHALGNFTDIPGLSLVFEVFGKENRVVVDYGYTGARLLAVRDSIGYISTTSAELQAIAQELNVYSAKVYHFDSLDEAAKAAQGLPNLEEGFVGYKNGVPCVKVKSPAYVQAHRMRGENGLTPKRILELIFMNEQDEYLAVFPEERSVIQPYQTLEGLAKVDMLTAFCELSGIESQKEFALEAVKTGFSNVLFQARAKGITTDEAYESLNFKAKAQILKSMHEKNKTVNLGGEISFNGVK